MIVALKAFFGRVLMVCIQANVLPAQADCSHVPDI